MVKCFFCFKTNLLGSEWIFFKRLFFYFVNFLLISSCSTVPLDKNNSQSSNNVALNSQKSLVLHYLDSAEPAKAHLELRKLIMQYPKDNDLQNLMGLTQLALKNPERALKYFKVVYENTKSPASGLNLSSALIDLGRNKEARDLLKKLKKENKNYEFRERIFHNIALTWEMSKNTKLAETYYLKALEENPSNYPTVIQLSKLYLNTNRDGRAEEYYKQAVNLCSVCFEPVKNLALIYSKNGNNDAAFKTLRKYADNKEIRKEDREESIALMSQLKNSKK